MSKFTIIQNNFNSNMFLKLIGIMLFFKVVRTFGSSDKKSIDEMIRDYSDDRNAMATVTETEPTYVYEDFYDEFDNRISRTNSMDMIFFGPVASFMRLDAESILYILVNTRKNTIPVSRLILAWDLLTDGKSAAFLQGREFIALGPLLNFIPEEELYFVNFGDPSVLNFFAFQDIHLHTRKYGILASAYKRYFGNNWHQNSTHINELGYILCGFPPTDLARIPPNILANVHMEVIGKLRKCSTKHVQTLYNIAIQPAAFDVPYRWSSHEVARLDYLLTYVDDQDISSIQLEAMRSISPAVINAMNMSKLFYFTKQQILQMNPKTRRLYLLRMQSPRSSRWDDIKAKAGNNKLLSSKLITAIALAIYLFVNNLLQNMLN